jgi:hypothetical protein
LLKKDLFGAKMKTENFTKWTYIRILIIVVTGMLNGINVSELDGVSPWLMIGASIIVMPLLMVIVTAMNARRYDAVWYPPSWHANPFTFKQPFQFFHLIAFQAFFSALAILVRSFWVDTSLILQVILNLSFGLGALTGIYFSMIIFSDRMFQEENA